MSVESASQERNYARIITRFAGIPIKTLSTGGNLSFNLETSYWYLDCPVLDHVPDPQLSNDSAWFQGQNINILSSEHNTYSSIPRALQLQTYSNNEDGEATTRAACNLTTSYVEGQVFCESKDCAVIAIRRSNLPHNSTNISSVDYPDAISTLNFFQAFITSTGTIHAGTPNPLAYYFNNPDAPYNPNGTWPQFIPSATGCSPSALPNY